MEFTLPLPVPTNEAYKTGKGNFYKSKEAKAWEDEAGYLLLAQRKNKAPFLDRVYVCLAFYFPNEHKDIDGGIKPVLDLLQRLNVYKNDRQVKHLVVLSLEDKKKPRLEIEVASLT